MMQHDMLVTIGAGGLVVVLIAFLFVQLVRGIARSEANRVLRGYVIAGRVKPTPRDKRGRYRAVR